MKKLAMQKTDGISMATAAAALMMAGHVSAGIDVNNNNAEEPVKISVCQDLHGAGQSACNGVGNSAGAGENSDGSGFVALSSGNDAFSAALCQFAGGTEATAATAPAEASLAGDAVEVTYCNDVFTCAGLSACKGNDNPNGAGQNTCHGIGFVGIYSGEKALSDQLCEKLGGTVLSSL